MRAVQHAGHGFAAYHGAACKARKSHLRVKGKGCTLRTALLGGEDGMSRLPVAKTIPSLAAGLSHQMSRNLRALRHRFFLYTRLPLCKHRWLRANKKQPTVAGCLMLAEKMGFEPMLHSSRTTPLAGEPLEPLGYFSTARDNSECTGILAYNRLIVNKSD